MGCGVGKLIKSRLVLFILLISLVSTLSGIAGCSLSSGQSTTPTENLQVKEQQSQSTKGSVEANKASTNPSDSETSGKLTVHFLDVGQADSALLQLPNNQTMLIDAGNNQDADFVVNYLKKAKVNKIDYLVGTHPHEDHIGGLDAVIKNFEIGKVIMPDATSTTRTFKDVLLQ